MTGCSENVHSHGLSVTVGLATQLVRVMRGSSVQRDMLALCWSIMEEIHMRTTHDEVDTRCCSGHEA